MNILFIHQNFPGQFKFLAPALAARGHRVVGLTLQDVKASSWQGVEVVRYRVTQGSTKAVHPWASDFETKLIRGEGCFTACMALREGGFTPDVIVAHPGWGESLFVKEVWPEAKLGIFCEFYYLNEGADTGFDPEFPVADPARNACRLKVKNLNNMVHFESADAAISPTQWQASTFPAPFRDKITVVHDGIDTDAIAPDADVAVTLRRAGSTGAQEPVTLTRDDQVVTFVNRNLEPMRGFHIFMRALPQLLRENPQAKVVIVGGTDVSYGARPSKATHGFDTWKEVYTHEVRAQISDADWARVHFVGQVPYDVFTSLLKLAAVHVYWTYPFVLSWSLIEAMSAQAAIVASDTAPLREVITSGENGVLVDFFDAEALAKEVGALLGDPERRAAMGQAARRTAVAQYDLQTVCLPRQIEWVEGMAQAGAAIAAQ